MARRNAIEKIYPVSKPEAQATDTADKPIPVVKVVKPTGFHRRWVGVTPGDLLAAQGRGTTQFERQVDAVAREMGIFFDASQYWVPLSMVSQGTRIDFVLFNGMVAVFCDGPVHEFRETTAQDDLVKRMELEGLGWKVVVIKYDEFMINPQGEVARVLWA